MEIKRRTFIASSVAAAAATQMPAAIGAAEPPVDNKIDPWNQPADLVERWKGAGKFLHQDDESRQDFTRGVAAMLGRTAALGRVDQLQATAIVERLRVVGDVAEPGIELTGEAVRTGDPLGQDLEDPDAQGVG